MIPGIVAGGRRSGAPATPLVWSPSLKAPDVVLSNSNRDAESTSAAANGGVVLATAGKTTGKWYAEVEVVQINESYDSLAVGLHRGTSTLTMYLGGNANGWGLWDVNAGNASAELRGYYNDGVTDFGSTGGGRLTTRRMVVAFDLSTTTGRVWLGDDIPDGATRRWHGGGNPATGALPTYTFTRGSSTYYLAGCPYYGDSSDASARNRLRLIQPVAARYAVPAGFAYLG